MNITTKDILAKMEQEIKKAQQAPEGAVQGHIYAIKTLAELATEKSGPAVSGTNSGTSYTATQPQQQPLVVSPQPQTSQPMSLSSQPIASDDGSNGDSIFDF